MNLKIFYEFVALNFNQSTNNNIHNTFNKIIRIGALKGHRP